MFKLITNHSEMNSTLIMKVSECYSKSIIIIRGLEVHFYDCWIENETADNRTIVLIRI